MKTQITQQFRKTLIKALSEGEIDLKDLGCELASVDDEPACYEDKRDWSDFKNLSSEAKAYIRLALRHEQIDMDKLFDLVMYG